MPYFSAVQFIFKSFNFCHQHHTLHMVSTRFVVMRIFFPSPYPPVPPPSGKTFNFQLILLVFISISLNAVICLCCSYFNFQFEELSIDSLCSKMETQLSSPSPQFPQYTLLYCSIFHIVDIILVRAVQFLAETCLSLALSFFFGG